MWKVLRFFLSSLLSVVLLDVTGDDMSLNLCVPQLQGKWLWRMLIHPPFSGHCLNLTNNIFPRQWALGCISVWCREVIYRLQITCFYHHFALYWKDNLSADMLVLSVLIINCEIPFSLLLWSGLLAFWIWVLFGLLVWHAAGYTLLPLSSWLCLRFCTWSEFELSMLCL